MPLKPSITCNHPGCPHLAIKNGYCDRHQGAGFQRDKTRQSLYSHKWSKASKAWLASNPWCALCMKQNVYTPATVVDHIKPHRGNAILFWDKSNWQNLCKHHHDQKTARGE